MAEQAFENPSMYNNGGPIGTPKATIGNQMYEHYWNKKALVEAAKEQYFGQMADTMNMPKHFGKTIKLFHYLPLLDDRNINSQGIDANGKAGYVTGADDTTNKYPLVAKYTIKVRAPEGMDQGINLFAGPKRNAIGSASAATAQS